MEKHPQDKLFNLAIVRSAGDKLRPLPVGPRWWGPPSPRRIAMLNADAAAVSSFHSKQVVMMPVQTQRFLLRVLRRLRLVWIYFGKKAQNQKETHAVTNVVAFRRTKGRANVQPDFAGKLPSGSVTYGSHEKSSFEGGRR